MDVALGPYGCREQCSSLHQRHSLAPRLAFDGVPNAHRERRAVVDLFAVQLLHRLRTGSLAAAARPVAVQSLPNRRLSRPAHHPIFQQRLGHGERHAEQGAADDNDFDGR